MCQLVLERRIGTFTRKQKGKGCYSRGRAQQGPRWGGDAGGMEKK